MQAQEGGEGGLHGFQNQHTAGPAVPDQQDGLFRAGVGGQDAPQDGGQPLLDLGPGLAAGDEGRQVAGDMIPVPEVWIVPLQVGLIQPSQSPKPFSRSSGTD